MDKKWYKSKGMIGGALVVLGGLATALGQYLQGNLDVASLMNTVIPLIGTGIGIIGIRAAK